MAYTNPNPDPGALGIYYTTGTVDSTLFAGVAPKGALLVDQTNALLYINTGTQASPTWTKVGTQT